MLERITEIMRDLCGIEEEITLQSCFVEDFGLSSLEMFQLITRLEEEFDVSISMRKLQKIRSVADLVNEVTGV